MRVGGGGLQGTDVGFSFKLPLTSFGGGFSFMKQATYVRYFCGHFCQMTSMKWFLDKKSICKILQITGK